jgi:protein-S-isoprenylcysteine O-methyltransferase Ste14
MPSKPHYWFSTVRLAVLFALIFFFLRAPGAWDAQRSVGFVLILIGAIGIAVAQHQLGSSFSLTAQARHLVTHGLYSKIRNPIYFFGLILFAGLPLATRRRQLWLLLPVVLVLQLIRARREAKVLEVAFGEDYRAYRRRTWF